jgi:hypothetical protein
VHRFRLALVDFEALRRSRDYLASIGVQTTEFVKLQGSKCDSHIYALWGGGNPRGHLLADSL